VQLEDLANKDAAEISNAASKALLAELPDDKNTNKGKSKDKKKKTDPIKAKDFEVYTLYYWYNLLYVSLHCSRRWSYIYNAYCRQLVVVRSNIPPVCLLSPLMGIKILVQVSSSSSIPPVCLLSPLNPMKMLVQVSSCSIRVNPAPPPCLSDTDILILDHLLLSTTCQDLNNKTSIHTIHLL
jgi:hypothetical protein